MTKLAFVILQCAAPATVSTFEATYPNAYRLDDKGYVEKPAGKQVYVLHMNYVTGEDVSDLDQFGGDLQVILAEDMADRSIELAPRNAALHQALVKAGGSLADIPVMVGMDDKTY